jgi:hypothetical protein
MDAMSLLEAFRALAPLTGDPDVDRSRNAAAGVILAALRRCAARVKGEAADLDDAVGAVLWRLTRRGPRPARPEDPKSDVEVERFLAAAVRNEVVSLLRRRGVVVDPKGFDLPDDRPAIGHAIDVERARAEIEAAREQLEREIVPAAAARLRAKAAEHFVRSLAELRDIAAGRRTVNEIVAAEDPESQRAGAAAWRRARNRVDKRFSRVFRSLGETIEELHTQGRIGRERFLALEIVVGELRVRDGEGEA